MASVFGVVRPSIHGVAGATAPLDLVAPVNRRRRLDAKARPAKRPSTVLPPHPRHVPPRRPIASAGSVSSQGEALLCLPVFALDRAW